MGGMGGMMGGMGGRGMGGMGMSSGGHGMGGMGGMGMMGMGGMGGGRGRGMGGMGGMMGGMGGMGMARQSVPAKLPDRYTPPTVTASGPIFARGTSASASADGGGRAAVGKKGKQRAKQAGPTVSPKPTSTDPNALPATGAQPAAGTPTSTQVF
jgi:hypothetical protein